LENCYYQYKKSSSDIIIKDIVSVTHDIRTNHWKHTHIPRPCYEIHFTLRGKISVSGEKHYINEANNFSFIIPKTDYRSNSIIYPTEVIGVFFEAELPPDIENNIFSSNFSMPGCSETIKNAFRNMSHIYYSKQDNYQLKIKKEMYSVFSLIADKIDNLNLKNSNYYTIRAADEYIKANYTKEDISVEQLAEICKITPAYFCRIFKDVFGVSPKKFIIDLKMKTAGEYLSFTSTPISEISKSLGYNELSYFTTAFKNHFGVTPSQYRKSKL